MNLPFRHLAVLGGHGQMGGLFVRRAEALGLAVQVYDQPLEAAALADRDAGLPQADLVLLAVPVTAMDAVLEAILPHLHPQTTLADVCSVKLGPMQAMLRAWNGPVVGTHPLFGPEPPEDARVALVQGDRPQDAEALARVTALFEAMGFACFRTTAEEHDRAMAAIQNLNFVTTVAYLAALSGDASLRPFLTPSFQRRLDASRKMLTQDATLFSTLFDANPYSMDLVRQYRNFLHVAAGGDMDLLIQHAQRWWEDASARSES
ncbi:prephenate dehydrogenase [Megalodesulfovibrio gigas]|uniref:Putative prephenate dehydrogenase n=1 Tax=Megalodesulfovibrio gigas (strain ATCC 19364 / DSM 1382 / NCIMB 9332 / VKM B-1759) TaxID=1121448 RepID=T2G8J7_MEGG1|nr:prephenate dehydrogenase [Megalodesulfovibrio gigas]AGW12504.1 putative prephenate dehydrogenase [Megalodesulfovibrio gigas DSM 1382 = ATCC 19364]